MKNARTLKTIEADLEAAFHREKQGPIEIGALLAAAKELLGDHGRWLPWLEAHFPHSISTAENYMAAYRFAAKFPTVGNLKVSPAGLYALVTADNHGNRELIDRVLREAATKWVSGDRVFAIARDIQVEKLQEEKPSPSTEPDDKPDADAAPDDDEPGPSPLLDEEPDDGDAAPPDDERPPPPLPPPPPELTPKRAGMLRDFAIAIQGLRPFLANRAADLAPASTQTFELEEIANLLLQVVKERSRAQTPAEMEEVR